MTDPIKYLFTFIVSLGCLAFIYGVGQACVISLHAEPNLSLMSVFLSSTVTSIAAVLATNLGAVLGISIHNPSSKFRQAKNWNPLNIFSDSKPTVIQTTACYVYVIALLAAAVVWATKNFQTEKVIMVQQGSETIKKTIQTVVPLIPELTKSLLGVIVGALAVALNAPEKPNPLREE